MVSSTLMLLEFPMFDYYLHNEFQLLHDHLSHWFYPRRQFELWPCVANLLAGSGGILYTSAAPSLHMLSLLLRGSQPLRILRRCILLSDLATVSQAKRPVQRSAQRCRTPSRDTRTEEREEARPRVSTFIAREGIHITLMAKAYKLDHQRLAGRSQAFGRPWQLKALRGHHAVAGNNPLTGLSCSQCQRTLNLLEPSLAVQHWQADGILRSPSAAHRGLSYDFRLCCACMFVLHSMTEIGVDHPRHVDTKGRHNPTTLFLTSTL